MKDLASELSLAREELTFWIDFAKWWRSKLSIDVEPRISELLENAKRRYANAQNLHIEHEKLIQKGEGDENEGKYFLRNCT
jgi:hypothetical protein